MNDWRRVVNIPLVKCLHRKCPFVADNNQSQRKQWNEVLNHEETCKYLNGWKKKGSLNNFK